MKATRALVILCVLTFILQVISTRLGYDEWRDYFAFNFNLFLEGRVWTPLSAIFLHADVIHLFINLIFLHVFGNVVEEEYGKRKLLGSFLFGGMIANLGGAFFYPPDEFFVGASGAIFTLIAITMLTEPLKSSLWFLGIPLGLVAIIYIIINLLALYYGIGGRVAYPAHVIGFAVGMLFGINWCPEWKKNLLITILLLVILLIIIHFLRAFGIL
jgi:rhomboid protease GluP